MDNKKVFALDIGTRSVTGIILKKQNDIFTVVDFCIKEHKNRSMLDGQIHDVVEVAHVISEVKKKLEINNGPLHSVCVAAAGRALKTKHGTATIELHQKPIIAQETIKHLELSAVQAAQLKLAKQGNSHDYSNYYCVGYSTLNYMLDDQIIGSLIDQSGDQASVDIIATFLPKVVVESLVAALSRADLEMEALTLEPIAAIQVLIPESMRRLNVGLIDIGAGTSDIAITNQGTIAAYGMVPMAGDEITEAISDHYLLDFPVAEQTKRNIVTNGEDVVSDILGFETTITYEELLEEIMDNIEKLASRLAMEIIQLNKQAPKAIMLIGGGSLTPEITKALAQKLQLPENRVAVRGLDAIQNLSKNDDLPAGPDFITPIGIAITARENPIHYISIKVNDQTVRMFEMKELTIGDCLVQAGIDIKKMYGIPGLASIITVNEQHITLPGEYGNPPAIHLNNKPRSVDHIVQDGDEILIKKGSNGKTPHVTIEEIIDDIPSMTVYFNDKKHLLKPTYAVNGQVKPKEYMITDRDKITVHQPKTIKDFFVFMNQNNFDATKYFSVFLNNKRINITKGQTKILINGQQVKSNHLLKNNDYIEVITAIRPSTKDLLKQENHTYWHTINVSFNGEKINMKQQQLTILRNGLEINPDTALKQDDHIEIINKKVNSFIFQDVFRYVDIDLDHVKGTFKIFKNNKPTTFYDIINDGDQLSIHWD